MFLNDQITSAFSSQKLSYFHCCHQITCCQRSKTCHIKMGAIFPACQLLPAEIAQKGATNLSLLTELRK